MQNVVNNVNTIPGEWGMFIYFSYYTICGNLPSHLTELHYLSYSLLDGEQFVLIHHQMLVTFLFSLKCDKEKKEKHNKNKINIWHNKIHYISSQVW